MMGLRTYILLFKVEVINKLSKNLETQVPKKSCFWTQFKCTILQ